MVDSEVDLSTVSLARLQEEIHKRTYPEFPPAPPRVPVVNHNEAPAVCPQDEPLRILEELVETFRKISAQMNPDKAVQTIIKETARLVHADRVSLYSVEATGDLKLQGSTGKAPELIPLGKGIPSHIAQTGQRYLVEHDVQGSPLFDASIDAGYETVNMLCAPALDISGKAVAVLEVVNKLPKGAAFAQYDATVATLVAAIGGMTLRYIDSAEGEKRANGLVDIFMALRSDINANSLSFTINRRVQDLLRAEKSTFFVCDHTRHKLWAASSDGSAASLPMSAGILGNAVHNMRTINVVDAQSDPSYDPASDQPAGLEAKSLLCCPILAHAADKAEAGRENLSASDAEDKAEERAARAQRPRRSSTDKNACQHTCVAVLQLVNKRGGGSFTKEDEGLLERICDLIGKINITENGQEVLDISHFCGRVMAGELNATWFDEEEGTAAFSNYGSPRCSLKASSNKYQRSPCASSLLKEVVEGEEEPIEVAH